MTPIFASDTTAAVLPLFVLVLITACMFLGLAVGAVAIAVNRKLGRRRWWGFAFGAFAVVFAAAALLLSFWIEDIPIIAGFPNYVLIPISCVPLLFGFYALLLWGKLPISRE